MVCRPFFVGEAMPKWRFAAAVAVLMTACSGVAAQDRNLSEVRFADADAPVPAVSLEDAAWFAGAWRGSVFGNTVEHRVEAPVAGQMPGIVTIYNADGVVMYELSSFMFVDGRLTYRNRHFGPDLTAWQEPEGYVDRPLVAAEEGILFFDGITFAANGPDAAVVTFVLTDEAGQQETHIVNYTRID